MSSDQDPLHLFSIITGDKSFTNENLSTSPDIARKFFALIKELFDEKLTLEELQDDLKQESNYRNLIALRHVQRPMYREDIDFPYACLLNWSHLNMDYLMGPLATAMTGTTSAITIEEMKSSMLALLQYQGLPSSQQEIDPNSFQTFLTAIENIIVKACNVQVQDSSAEKREEGNESDTSFVIIDAEANKNSIAGQGPIAFDWYTFPINRFRRELELLLSSDNEGQRYAGLLRRRKEMADALLSSTTITGDDVSKSNNSARLPTEVLKLLWKDLVSLNNAHSGFVITEGNVAQEQEAFYRMHGRYESFYRNHLVDRLSEERDGVMNGYGSCYAEQFDSSFNFFSNHQLKRLLRRSGILFQLDETIAEVRFLITKVIAPCILRYLLPLHQATRHVFDMKESREYHKGFSSSWGTKPIKDQLLYSVITSDTMLKALTMTGFSVEPFTAQFYGISYGLDPVFGKIPRNPVSVPFPCPIYGYGSLCGTSTNGLRYLFVQQIEDILKTIDPNVTFADEVALSVAHDLVIYLFTNILQQASLIANDVAFSAFSGFLTYSNNSGFQRPRYKHVDLAISLSSTNKVEEEMKTEDKKEGTEDIFILRMLEELSENDARILEEDRLKGGKVGTLLLSADDPIFQENSIINQHVMKQAINVILMHCNELTNHAHCEALKGSMSIPKVPLIQPVFMGFGMSKPSSPESMPATTSLPEPLESLGRKLRLQLAPEWFALLTSSTGFNMIPMMKGCRLTLEALVYATVVCEYLMAEVFEVARMYATRMRDPKLHHSSQYMITSRDLMNSIREDTELSPLFPGLFRDAGGSNYIHPKCLKLSQELSVDNEPLVQEFMKLRDEYCCKNGEGSSNGRDVHFIHPLSGDFVGRSTVSSERDSKDPILASSIQPVPLINTIFDHFFPVNPEILAAVSSGERNLNDDVDQSLVGLGHCRYRQIQAIFQEKKSSSGEKKTLEDDISAICQDPAATWVRRLNEVVHEQGRVDPILHLETLEDLFQSHCATDEIHRHCVTHSSLEFSYESMDMVRTFIEGMFCHAIGPTAVELALHANRLYVNASDIKMAWNMTRR